MVKWKVSARKYATGSRQVWRYRHADFDKACCLLEKVNWVTELADCSDVNDAINVFHSHFLHVMLLKVQFVRIVVLPGLVKILCRP